MQDSIWSAFNMVMTSGLSMLSCVLLGQMRQAIEEVGFDKSWDQRKDLTTGTCDLIAQLVVL
jgi:hypothetical protein